MSTTPITFVNENTHANGLSLCLQQSTAGQRMYETHYGSSSLSSSPQVADAPQLTADSNNTSHEYLNELSQKILNQNNRQKVLFSPFRDRYPEARPFVGYQVDDTNGSWVAFPDNDPEVKYLHLPAPFIATCAPLPAQFDSFMNMLVKYNCQILLTLTDPIEGNKFKADPYLPGSEGIKIMRSSHTLKCLKMKTLANLENGWTIRSGEYRLKPPQATSSLHFENLHVSNWKDGTEGDPNSLLELVKTVYEHKMQFNTNAPIVVHCSMGIGRTGEFIGCYRIYQKAVEEGKILTDQEIFMLAVQMRLQRTSLGGGEKQYQMLFLFRDLLAARPELNKPINTQAN